MIKDRGDFFMSKMVAVILAAGKGTRMRSKLPKVLHKVGGKPMLEHVMAAAETAGADKSIVVVGFGSEQVAEFVGNRAEIAVQAEQLGTGHANYAPNRGAWAVRLGLFRRRRLPSLNMCQ